MYYLINRNIDHILACITQAYIDDYQTILQIVADPDANIIENAEFRGTYRRYWAMQGRFLNSKFYDKYFLILNNRHDQRHLNNSDDVLDFLRTILKVLYKTTNNLQFSFATKLLHCIWPIYPIYDSRVLRFFLKKPPDGKPWKARLERYCDIYTELLTEQARVLDHGLLEPAIIQMREWLEPQVLTDCRLIDMLIWNFVGCYDAGHIQYE